VPGSEALIPSLDLDGAVVKFDAGRRTTHPQFREENGALSYVS
jgi:hypothetical protein